jgi:hypothetical protein
MAPQRNLYTISDAIAHKKQMRLENEARERTQSQWRRQEAAQKSFLQEQDRILRSSISALPRPSKTTDYFPTRDSFPVSKPDGRGNSGRITFGIILAIAICWYALAHGATLTAIAGIAILIAAAVVAIAIALAVIAFVRAFAGPIIAIGLVGWYLWAHHHG